MFIAEYAGELIGRTPMLALTRLFPDSRARVLAKLECLNPTSIKDRPVLNMIRAAMAAGKITPDTEVVEASSGNTAIAISQAAQYAAAGSGERFFGSFDPRRPWRGPL